MAAPDDRVLEKTNRLNLLLDFYEPLLTDKQRMFLKQYVVEDFSLAEIAEMAEISRQAVFEHIKRAEATLEDYESKLKLLAKHEARGELITELVQLLEENESLNRETLAQRLNKLSEMD